MREIKFRAWDAIAKQMAPLSNKFINLGSGYVFENVRDGLEGTDELVYSKRFILMQYTGLKDKSGKEIYEGDIVKDCDTSDSVFAVKWDETKAGYFMPVEFDEEYAYSISAVTLEVIGNIYQNPELIK